MRMTHKKILAMILAFITLTGSVVHAESTAPVAENMELTTYRNTSVGGRMSAVAARGSTLQYTVTTEPTKGTLDVSQDGHFIYTPNANKKGRDYFGYKAVDENGTESQEATVIIHIQRKTPAIRYTDTQGLGCDYAASVLAERDIFTGIQVGGAFYFHPEETMTQNEFVSMCMALCEVSDSSALTVKDSALLTYGDAAVILNDLLNIAPVSCMAADGFTDTNVESLQAISNLISCGILPVDAVDMTLPLRRDEASNMLLRAAGILDARK